MLHDSNCNPKELWDKHFAACARIHPVVDSATASLGQAGHASPAGLLSHPANAGLAFA